MNMFHDIVLKQSIALVGMLNEEKGNNCLPLPEEKDFEFNFFDQIACTSSQEKIFYQVFFYSIDSCRLEVWRNIKEPDHMQGSYTRLYNVPIHPLFSVEDNFQVFMIKEKL